jgi:hypothetical protein
MAPPGGQNLEEQRRARQPARSTRLAGEMHIRLLIERLSNKAADLLLRMDESRTVFERLFSRALEIVESRSSEGRKDHDQKTLRLIDLMSRLRDATGLCLSEMRDASIEVVDTGRYVPLYTRGRLAQDILFAIGERALPALERELDNLRGRMDARAGTYLYSEMLNEVRGRIMGG